MVAANELLQMEVKDRCGKVIFSREIGPFINESQIGPFDIPYGSYFPNVISGLAVNCLHEPVSDGYAKISVNGYSIFTPLEEFTGAFNCTVTACDEAPVIINLVDNVTGKVSLPLIFDSQPVVEAGTVEVCENNLEYVDLEVVGLPDHIILPFPDVHIYEGGTILVVFIPDSLQVEHHFDIRINGTSAGTYTPYFASVGITLPSGEKVVAREFDMSVVISHFGIPGDYITGTLSGTLNTVPGQPGGSQYPLLGKFSVLRE
jgi:hypothetical protein